MQSQHALRAARIVAHLGAHVVYVGDNLARQLQKSLAGLLGFHAARMAIEQLNLELVLQQRQAAGSEHDDEAGLGSACQVAQFSGANKQRQRVDVGQYPDTVHSGDRSATRAIPALRKRQGATARKTETKTRLSLATGASAGRAACCASSSIMPSAAPTAQAS